MNHLQNEISPYLLAHATNPVDWYPWNETALNLAKSLNKPIFLSIGYSACHWCHVMEEESFKDPKVADFLNENFISLKVDREERPDLDKIYMDALVAMTGSGGWPMSIFLTPDLIPFFAGTYFPPQARYNMPAFLDLLQNIQNAWLHDREKLSEYSQKVKKAISKKLGFESKSDVDFQNLINQSVTNHFQYMDKMNGGWGQQPKFPHPLVILFLLDQRIKLSNTQKMELKNSLDAMIKGGFYDLLRGGFHRYSTDQIWLVPHFEKMLYDNALLARVYLYAGILYKNDNYIQIATETLDYLVDEMQGPHGGFFSSQDADSAGEEGTYYTWDYEETRSMLPPQLWKEFIEVFNISKNGNFEGRNILRKSNEISLSKPLKDKLLELQSERERPLTDDKILADWNGLAISALSIAGRVLQNSKYTHSAVRAAEFVKEHLTNTNILHHAFRAGEVRSQAFLSDYSFMINGMLDLFMSTQDGKWLKEASQWTDKMVSIFWDGNEFFDSRIDDVTLITRPQTLEDSVVPSGWSYAVQAIQRLNATQEDETHQSVIKISYQKVLGFIETGLLSNAVWLQNLLNTLYSLDYIVLVYPTDDIKNAREMEAFIRPHIHPELLFFALQKDDPLLGEIPILQEKKCVSNNATVYICVNHSCSNPINSLAELQKQFYSLIESW